MMVLAQMRNRGRKVPKGLQAPQSVTVTSMLTAQWPIETQSHEKVLLMAQDIEEKVKAADLAGSKETEKLSPEEEELEEEAGQAANQSGNDEGQQPRQPQFLFIAVLSEQDRRKAMADAAVKARQQAAELAAAAGVESVRWSVCPVAVAGRSTSPTTTGTVHFTRGAGCSPS